MMGETTGLPLPSASPAPAALAATTATAATAGPSQEAAVAQATPPGLLFDLLLGEQPEAASASLAAALPASAHAPVDERQEEASPADPLLAVLAQMPQMSQMSPPPATPATTDAAPRPLTLAGLAAGPSGMPAPIADAAGPVAASAPLPVAGSVAGTTPETGAAAPAARFPLSQQGFALQAATGDTPLAGFVLPTAEQAPPPVEASAPGAVAPLNAMQSLAAAQPASPSAPVAGAPVLQQPADPANGYDDRFGSHVALLAGQRIGQAEIRVVPEHLGAIDIRLQLDGSSVRAEFHSAQPEVRQALEASLPRLREMLGQHGLQLAHAGVGQGQSGQRQSGEGMPQPGQPGTPTLPDDAGSPLPPDFRRARSLLDVYA